MSLTELDLKRCIRYNEQKSLCPLSSSLYELRVDLSICDVRLMNDNSKQVGVNQKYCADRWIKLQIPDSWLLTCCEKCKFPYFVSLGSGNCRSTTQWPYQYRSRLCFERYNRDFTIQGHHDYISQLYSQDYRQKKYLKIHP